MIMIDPAPAAQNFINSFICPQCKTKPILESKIKNCFDCKCGESARSEYNDHSLSLFINLPGPLQIQIHVDYSIPTFRVVDYSPQCHNNPVLEFSFIPFNLNFNDINILNNQLQTLIVFK